MLNYSVIIECSAVDKEGLVIASRPFSLTTELEKGIGLKKLVESAEDDFSKYLISIGYKVFRGAKFSYSKDGVLCSLEVSWKNPEDLFN